jgi:hypothetical protein
VLERLAQAVRRRRALAAGELAPARRQAVG